MRKEKNIIQIRKLVVILAIIGIVIYFVTLSISKISNVLVENDRLNLKIKLLETCVSEKDSVISNLKSKEAVSVGHNNKNGDFIDTNYKLFFGEWEVTKIIAEDSRFGAEENAKKLLGSVFYYNYDVIKKDGMVTSNDPTYYYYVLPNNNKNFLRHMPLPSQIGIKGDFFIFIEIKTSENLIDGKSFYVKDDNTLILYDNNVFYEMKRKSFIRDNISEEYEHI